MALVEEDAVDDALDGLVDRRVVEDDVRGLAAELEGELLVGAGDRARDRLADLGRAGERDLVDAGVLDERAAGLARAGDDVDDAGRQVGLLADVGEEQRGERRGLGRLEHDGVAGGERRRDLPRQHEQREVPRDDLRRDAERARVRAEARVLELVGPAGVVEEVRRDQRDVDVARLLDRLAVVEASRATASSRERSCTRRAMRNRYLPRSAPDVFDHTRV